MSVNRLRVDNAIQMHESFPVTLFIKLFKVVLTFGFLDKILKCHYGNKRYVYYSIFQSSGASAASCSA